MAFYDSPEQIEKDIQALQVNNIKEFQVENTSRCNLKCVMCDRKGLGKDMDDDLINKIISRFPAVTEVFINGLGEPLLSHNILRLLNGPGVHFLSNGISLNEHMIQAILESEVKSINISMDGATSSSFQKVHGVNAFDKILNNIRMLVKNRNSTGRKKPRLSFGVVMMKRNMDDWAALVRLAYELGLDRVSFMNLTPCREEHLGDILYDFPGRKISGNLLRLRDKSVREARNLGNELGIKIAVPSFDFIPAQIGQCFSLGRKLYISADGDVSVCPILSTKLPRLGNGCLTEPTQYVFDNLQRCNFEQILSSDPFRNYQEGIKAGKVPEYCIGCNWIHGL